ncbi:hypothetical protein CHI10_20680 [Bacillus sp. 7894-2]|nr:hypothetical protein CHI10_20680 [Bacillus sp. 7894-2]
MVLGIFHAFGNPLYSADQALTRRSAIGSDLKKFPQDFRFPALHLSHPDQQKTPSARSAGVHYSTFFQVIGKHFRKHISYYAKKPDERKERLIDMVIL